MSRAIMTFHPDQWARDSAIAIAGLMRAAIASNDTVSVALAGGGTAAQVVVLAR